MHFTTLQKEASSFDSVTMDPSLSCIWREIQFRPQRKEAVQFYFERQWVCSFQFEIVFVMMFYDKIPTVARLQSLRPPCHNWQQTIDVLINIKTVTRYCRPSMQMSIICVHKALINLSKTAKQVSNNLNLLYTKLFSN